ncbi:VOC family protein [Phormidium tenue FACHB-886]|nr:VOC family protein [Phormidium tenue FACHB-886]
MQVNTYLMFNGNCEAAFKFYEQCLGGKIINLLTHENAPSAEQVPAEWHDKIMHVCLDLSGRLLMGSDCPPGYFEAPQGFYVQLSIDESAEAERIFQALAENGKVKMPFEQTFWAFRFGMLVDQFGTPWMVNCEQAA